MSTIPRSRVSLPSGSSDTSGGLASPINPLSMGMGVGMNSSTNMTPEIYLQRLVDLSQMDIQSALDQMKSLLIPSEIQNMYETIK